MEPCVFVWVFGKGILMAQGLQCWDGSGRIVVDLGDYNMRYMGSTTLSIAAGQTSWTIGWAGMRTTGWLPVLASTQFYNEFYCIPQNGSFAVQYLPTGGSYAQTLTFEIYKYEV